MNDDDKTTWEVRFKERDQPGGGTERATERVTAWALVAPGANTSHFTWFNNGVIRSYHQDIVESVRIVQPDGAA